MQWDTEMRSTRKIMVLLVVMLVSVAGVAQTARTEYCQKKPGDLCCADDAKDVPACWYVNTRSVPVPPGQTPITAGISRPDVLDSYLKDGKLEKKVIIENQSGGATLR
jgi:hypothetical protein